MMTSTTTETPVGSVSFKTVLSRTMHALMKDNDHVIVMGQGVVDPIRIFGTLNGLVEDFGSERVLEMPICEEGMTGVALGAALNGVYPIQTHIRMDFLMLAMNQLINHVAKYRYMYGGSFRAPMLIRTIVGRSWGQGPQHSQSLQAMMSHVPGLKVIMPSNARGMQEAYRYAVEQYDGPVLSIEHRWLYDTTFKEEAEDVAAKPFAARIVETGADVTIVACSYMVQEAQRAALWVKEHSGLSCDIIDPFLVSEIDHDLIFASVNKTGRLIVADTSYLNYGMAAEVARGLMMRDPAVLTRPMEAIGLQFVPTPTSHRLESHYYPDSGSIVNSIFKLVHGDRFEGALPSEELKKSQWVKFKGPFSMQEETSMFKGKKVLVTGGTGLIGRPLVDLLLERGAQVRIVSLDDPSRANQKAEFKRLDLTNMDNAMEAADGMDFVFQLAGIKGSPAMTAKKPASFFYPTISFNTNMMEASRRCGVKKYLFTSSIGVYSPAEVFHEDAVWSTMPSPNDRFAGWAKRMGELQAEAYQIEYGWDDVYIVRPANVYGPYDNFDPANAMVIPSLVRRALDGENPFTVWGDGSTIRDFIHSRDCARGMLTVFEKGYNKPVNLGSGQRVSVRQIVEIILKNMPNPPEVVWDTSKPSGDRIRLMDTTRMTEAGFTPSITIEEGVKEVMAWYQANKAKVDSRYNVFTEGPGARA